MRFFRSLAAAILSAVLIVSGCGNAFATNPTWNVTTFTASGTWTYAGSVTWVSVLLVGGGGGGHADRLA